MADKNSSGPEKIMAPSAIRAALALAKRGDAVSCAIALSKDKEGIVFVDKHLKPNRKLLGELRKKAGGAGVELETATMRFGSASVDPERGAGLLILTVNKDPAGAMRPKLLDVLKKAGFAKLEIMVDPALDAEPDEDDATTPAEPALGAPPPPPASPAVTSVPAATQAPAAPPDMAALTRELTDLVRRMATVIAADPARGQTLKPLAVTAQAALKAAPQSGDAAPVAAAIRTLAHALDQPATPPATSPATPPAALQGAVNVAALAKASNAWLATRQKVEGDIARLRTRFAAVFKDHDHVGALIAGFDARVETVLHQLDEALAHRLADVTRTTDPSEHAKIVDDAKRIIQRYEAFLASDPTIGEMDANPLVPLTIRKTLTATLDVLSRAVA